MILFLLAALLLGAGVPPAAAVAASWSGHVTHVTDGDTLWVQPAQGGPTRKIRLEGVDAPEICQTHGGTARDALATHVQGRAVQVVGRRTDDYGRLLARVRWQGEDVGAWLVTQGHAWSYGRNQHDAGPYAAQQEAARAQRRGLWQARAVSPRTFRRRHGSCH